MMRRFSGLLLGIALLLMALPAAAGANVIKVDPGDSIQAAVDQASPGDTVQIAPGTYTEAGSPCPSRPGRTCAVVVTKDDIGIVGRGGGEVVLEAAGDQEEGIAIGKSADPSCLTDPSLQVHGSLVRGLTVRGFEDDGIFHYCVNGFRVTDVRAIDNGEYGVYPSHSLNGRVDHSFVSGANDTGFYIGQASDSRMDHNLATGNVSGYEIENSTRVRLDHNVADGNTGGILVFTLPFLDVKFNSDNVVEHNTVRNNNRDNTCVDPDDAVCAVPPGTGILVMAADANLVRHNDVTGNDSFGIAVTNICVAQQLPDAICAILDIQTDSDDNRVTFNNVTGNAGNPAPSLPPVFAQDLVWDTTGTGNCWSNNVFGTSFPADLPAC